MILKPTHEILFSTLILTLFLAGSGFSQLPGLDAPVAIGAYLDGTLPQVAPGASTGWNTVNAFPNLTFVDPLWLTPVPGTGDLLLVGKNGRLWRCSNNPSATQGQVVKVLEWVANTQSSEDQGFYSLAFHPEFGQTGSPNKDYACVCYSYKPALAGADSNHSYWRVSRFTWLPASGTLDPASESVLINQFDPDLCTMAGRCSSTTPVTSTSPRAAVWQVHWAAPRNSTRASSAGFSASM